MLRSMTRPRRFGLAPSHGWSLNAHLERLRGNSCFSKRSGGAQVTADHKQRLLLYDKDEADLAWRADTPLPFGKHKVMTYGEIVRDDPHKCADIAELQDLRPAQEVLQLGKHTGKTFKEVMAEDQSYCLWVVDLSTEDASLWGLIAFQRFLKDRGLQAPVEDMMTVGKHKGKTFKEVMAEDPAYCAWVLDPSFDRIGSPVMSRFKRFLEDRGFESYAEDVMTIGKHRGKTFEDIVIADPLYCELVMSRMAEKGTKNCVMLRFKKFLENHAFFAPQSDDGISPGDNPMEVLGVGKHKGKTFAEVLQEDPMYCSWVMDLRPDGGIPGLQRFRKFLEKKGCTPPSEHSITTVLHGGKTFEEVFEENPLYCAWVMGLSAERTRAPSLVRFKKFLKDRGFQAPTTTQEKHGAVADSGADTPTSIVSVGKHKGKSFEVVMSEDPSYCSWVLSTDSASFNPMLGFKTYLLENRFFGQS